MRWLLACLSTLVILTACSNSEGISNDKLNSSIPQISDLKKSSTNQDEVLPTITPSVDQSIERIDTTNETPSVLNQVKEKAIDVWNIEIVGDWLMGASFSSLQDKIMEGAFEGRLNKYGEVVFTNKYFDLYFRDGILSSVYVEKTGFGIGKSLLVGDAVTKADDILGKPDARMETGDTWYLYGDITESAPLELKINDGKIVAISCTRYSEGSQTEHQAALNYLNQINTPLNPDDKPTALKLTKNQLNEIFETTRSDMKKFVDIHKMDNSEKKKEQITEILDIAYEIQVKLEEAQQGNIETDDKVLTDALLQYTNTIYDGAYLLEYLLLTAEDKNEIASYRTKISDNMYASIKLHNEINTYLLVNK